MFCPNCGAEFPENAEFCMNCGSRKPSSISTSAHAAIPQKNTNAPANRRKLRVIGIVALIFAATTVFLALFGNGTSAEIATVQNGFLGEYTDMTVKEILDTYYGTLYEADGVWDSGITDSGTTIVHVEYSSDLLGTTTIQFSMHDEDCFKVTAFVDPFEDVQTISDLLAVLSKIYIASYELQYDPEEFATAEAELLDRLSEVNATAVRYGAAEDYTGDRSQLYQLFNDSTIEITVTELLSTYGIIDSRWPFTGDGLGSAATDFSWLEGKYETTSPGSVGCSYLVLAFDGASFEETAQSWSLNFHIYWESYDGEEYYDDYKGMLYYQNESNEMVFSGVCTDLSNAEEYPVTMTYDGMYFHVCIGDDIYELSFYG